jgi:hypothetical protein
VLRTLNNSIRTLLLHASIPPSYWAEALATTCYLLNRRPCSSINNDVPFTRLHGKPPQYDHLRVFGCLCYPNLQVTSAHKLAARSTACVFLGYPSSHKGYRCLDLSSRRIIISRHVVFDESIFPFTSTDSITNSSVFDFLLDVDEDTVHCSTNPAAVHSRGHPPGSVVAPSPPDVERPLPTSTTLAVAPSAQDVERSPSPTSSAAPHGCGLAPPSGSDVLLPRAGGCGLVPPPVAPRDATGLVPSLPHFYTRRPAASTSSTATTVPSAASPPTSVPTDPPAAARPMTRTQTGTIPRVQYKGLITATIPSPVPSNYRSGLADPN